MSKLATTIKINADYNEYLPQLSKQDYDKLKQSIKENGLYNAITLNNEGFILDGHHRYRICRELGIDPRFEVKTFKSEYERLVKEFDSR